MGGLKTIQAAALIGFAAALQALSALTPATAGGYESARDAHITPAAGIAPNTSRSPIDGLTREFAYCAGRLSATLEHKWLVLDASAQTTQAQREAMISLLDAVAPADRGPDILALRLSAKHAQARLLSLESFDSDPAISDRAARTADAHLESCLSLILG